MNGVYAVFRVEAVMNAARILPENSDRRQRDAKRRESKRPLIFSRVLDTAVNDKIGEEEALGTATYGKDGRMSDIRYRSKEYHY